GFGQGSTAFVVAVQSAVPWTMRGVATSTTQLFRNLGGTVGVALLGALLNERLQRMLPPGVSESAALLNPAAGEGVGESTVAALEAALAAALQPVFGILLGLAVVCWLVVWRWATPDALKAALAEAEAAEASRGR